MRARRISTDFVRSAGSIRRTLLALLAGLLLICAATVGAFLLSERLFFGAVKATLAFASPYRLQLVDASLTWRPFHLTAAQLLISPDDASSPPLFALQALEVSGSVLDWLSGETTGRLRAANLSVYIDEKAPSGRPQASTLLEPLLLFPSRIDIDTLHLVSRGDDVWIFPLLNLSAEKREGGAIAAIATTTATKNTLVLEALLTPRTRFGVVQAVDIKAGVLGRGGQNALTLAGQVRGVDDNLFYDLALTGEYANVGDFLTAFDENAIALEGQLSVAGQLTGNLDELELTFERLAVENGEDYELQVQGSMRQAGDASPTLAVTATGSMAGTASLPILPAAVRERLGTSAVSLRVRGTLADPLIDRAELYATTPGGIELTATTSALKANPQDLEATIGAAAVQVTVGAQSSAAIGSFLERDLPPFGAWSLAGTLHNDRGIYRISDLEGSAALHDNASLTISGDVGSIARRDDLLQIRAMDLELALDDAGDGSWWQAHGGMSAAGLLPRRGSLSLRGGISDASTLQGVDLSMQFSGLSLQGMADSPAWVPVPLTMNGAMHLSRATSDWHLHDVNLEGAFTDDTQLALSGSISGIPETPTADLTLALSNGGYALPSPASVGLRSNRITAQLRLRERYATVLGEISTPHAPIQTVMSADLENGVLSSITADLYTARLDLADVSLRLNAAHAETDVSAETPAFDWHSLLPPIPVHATVRIDELYGTETAIDSLVVDIDADAQRYLLKQFDMRYAKGSLQLRGLADMTGTEPALSIAGLGVRVPLAALTRDLGLTQNTRGNLSVRGGLAATGTDLAMLTSSLNGRLALALDHAVVSGAAYDLLMSNLLAWLAVGANEKTTTFDCSMAQFDLHDGIASSDSLYIETPRMVATGKARLDLPGDALDVRLEPRSRSRTFQFPSAVKVGGSLSAPTVSVSPLQSTADAAAQALLLLPSLTLKLFGIGNNDEGLIGPCEAALQ